MMPSLKDRGIVAAMSPDEKLSLSILMKDFGGSFVAIIADAYQRADANNKARIEYAFADYFVHYKNFGEKS